MSAIYSNHLAILTWSSPLAISLHSMRWCGFESSPEHTLAFVSPVLIRAFSSRSKEGDSSVRFLRVADLSSESLRIGRKSWPAILRSWLMACNACRVYTGDALDARSAKTSGLHLESDKDMRVSYSVDTEVNSVMPHRSSDIRTFSNTENTRFRMALFICLASTPEETGNDSAAISRRLETILNINALSATNRL